MKIKYNIHMQGSGYENKFSQTVQMHEDTEGTECQVVNLYPEITYEMFEGFGGAVTESAAYVYSLMNEAQKRQVITTYFSPENMNYRLVRIHMDSCDFCLDTYEAMSDPNDQELLSFSFERTEKYVIPMLEDIKKVRGEDLKLMLSPWSPPAFMKTSNARKMGGKLKPEYQELWAKYICRYIREFTERGYDVQRISIQNEPNAIQRWDSCLFTAKEEKIFLKDYMYPALKKYGFEGIEIFIWDHNKERIFERVRDIVDEDTKNMTAGAAFHWYSGDHFEAMELLRTQYPNMKMIMSESCLEYSIFDEKNIEQVTSRLCHEIIGDMNHGMCAFYDWNLLLDENGGPNHAGNYCHAPFLYDTKRNVLMPQKTQTEFYQFSHYIRPGSKRIAVTKYSEQIDVTAYQTSEEEIAVLLLNKSEQLLPINIRMHGKVGALLIPPKTLAACVITLL
ncbi:glycoside hydrolase family 30 protein [Faecalimonas sp. LCP19S3_D12]